MSKATYWQRGETLDYTNPTETTIDANSVVKLVGRIGIAGTDIAPKETGSLHVEGIYSFDKTSTNKIEMGTPVYFDDTGITEAADNGQEDGSKVSYIPAGYAAEVSAADAKKIIVKIG